MRGNRVGLLSTAEILKPTTPPSAQSQHLVQGLARHDGAIKRHIRMRVAMDGLNLRWRDARLNLEVPGCHRACRRGL